ncbi:MAG TPA: hypothetical protein VEJ87_13010, partial [Acidimicrobiales bacterium]|nr:hypothetical protein [Acidimicrobiales bacterium]
AWRAGFAGMPLSMRRCDLGRRYDMATWTHSGPDEHLATDEAFGPPPHATKGEEPLTETGIRGSVDRWR